ncbi:MAG: heparan-alpha-glucosaminide N-acetyltransferase domain-containing protein [Promethearchaeota archaeon]
MKIQRLKSIDIFRGLCMVWIVLTHLLDWWLKSEFHWFHRLMIMIFDPIGASGLLFISGVSVTLSHRRKLNKVNLTNGLKLRTVRTSYFMRALLILTVALIYNSLIAVSLKDPSWVWTWFVLMTAAVSLLIAWPLLKTPKLFRIILGSMIWIMNPFIVTTLLPHEGSLNVLGVLFHFFYNGINQVPLLVFFPFFLFGTVIGDTIYNAHYSNSFKNAKNKTISKKYFLFTFLFGSLLILTGVLFKYPRFLKRESLSWVIYSLGIDTILISILLLFEVLNTFKTKKSYRLLFYYSYYSLTIFLAHNILHFLFLEQLGLYYIWLFAGGTMILLSIILRFIYKKWQGYASIKIQIGRISQSITERLEEKLKSD